jgi:hypothetical protein
MPDSIEGTQHLVLIYRIGPDQREIFFLFKEGVVTQAGTR